MPFLALSLELDGLDPSRAEDICFDHGALAVTLTDARGEPVFEPQPGELKLWRCSRLEALFSAEQAEPTLLTRLAQALHIDTAKLTTRAVADRIWEREWLRDFHAMRFGRRLWICPRHETVTASDAVVVQLDPGLAFGTGSHATTRLCLEWLDQTPLEHVTLMDYGCGSGVLAIAALKLGASAAYAFDIDPQALLATRDNALANRVAARLQLCSEPPQLPRRCDYLLANIVSDTLIAQRAALAMLVRGGGEALLCGILVDQEPEVADAFAKWFDMRRFAQREGWVALIGTRNFTD
jgi:ribosomal protein L11 methyltransferase